MNLDKVTIASFLSTCLILSIIAPPCLAAIADRQYHAKQSSSSILSFFTRQQTTKPPLSPAEAIASGTASATTASASSIASMATLASGIQALPSIQSILDASGITRLTDPVWNQVRKQWMNIVNSGIIRRVMNPIKSTNSQKRRIYA